MIKPFLVSIQRFLCINKTHCFIFNEHDTKFKISIFFAENCDCQNFRQKVLQNWALVIVCGMIASVTYTISQGTP